LADVCVDGPPSLTPTPRLQARQDSDEEGSQEESFVEVTKTATQCASSGLLNCPASLQLVREYIATETPRPSIVQTVDFGEGAGSLQASSGAPKSYIPPPPKATGSSDTDDGRDGDNSAEGGSSKEPDLGLIIGLSVGLGVPALVGILAALWWYVFHLNCSPKAFTESSPLIPSRRWSRRRKARDGTVVTIISSESRVPSTQNNIKTQKTNQHQTEVTSASSGS
jgi:hypothetical protein